MPSSAGGASKKRKRHGDRAQLRSLAAQLLPHTDRIGDDLVELIMVDEPAYSNVSLVGREDLRRSCRTNIARIVQSLSGQVPPHVDPLDAPGATGRQRAAQGMPLEAVLHSYRLGGRLVWNGIVDLVGDDPTDHAVLELLRTASLVWEEIDKFSAALAQAYRAEESRRRTQHRHQQQRDVLALLSGDLDAGQLATVADRLGLAGDASFAVVAVLIEDPEAPLFALADELAGRHVHAVWAVATGAGAGLEVGLVRLGSRGHAGLLDILARVSRQRLGLSPVMLSLREAQAGIRLAELAARTLNAPGVAAVEQRLPEALVLAAPELAGLLLEQTVDRLLARPSDGTSLLATVETLLAERGSFSCAAARLFVHRNTVIHRISRVAELSGNDPTTAQGSLLWSLALVAHEHRGQGSVRG